MPHHQTRYTRLMRALLAALLFATLLHAAEYPKAFLNDQQIWLQLDADHPPLQASHSPGGSFHSGPIISPDGNTIAYGVREPTDPQHMTPLRLVFIDWSGRELRRFEKVPIDEYGACGYAGIEWIDSIRLGVECEYNPSVEYYVILDSASGKVLNQYSGL